MTKPVDMTRLTVPVTQEELKAKYVLDAKVKKKAEQQMEAIKAYAEQLRLG